MSRTHRLFDLLQELRARRRPATAAALAAALGVSIRTIYRDIDVLRAQGARIEGAAGLGYVLRAGFTLPPLMFTREEIEALRLGAAWVARRDDLGMAASARGALAKIAAVLPEDLSEALDASGHVVGRLREPPAATIDPGVVRDALRRERKLAIGYVDAGATPSERTIWPVAIGVYEETQVLAAWCELRGDYRHFRMDRIHAATVLEARPPRRRAALFREWRARERDCIPEDIRESGQA